MLVKLLPPGQLIIVEDATTGKAVIHSLREHHQLPPSSQLRLEQNGRQLTNWTRPLTAELGPVTVLMGGGLPGGKGGFGSMLRSIGAQIERTTNHEAMRDLSGRRQRDINNEKRLQDYVAKQGERDREDEERKEKRLEKLRKLADGETKGRLDFSDPVYDKERGETELKIHEAMEAALATAPAACGSIQAQAAKNTLKRAAEPCQQGTTTKRVAAKGLWLGEGLDDLADSDLSSDDDTGDDEEGKKSGKKV